MNYSGLKFFRGVWTSQAKASNRLNRTKAKAGRSRAEGQQLGSWIIVYN